MKSLSDRTFPSEPNKNADASKSKSYPPSYLLISHPRPIIILFKFGLPFVKSTFCPFCNAPYHRIEFFEWLKVKAYCPNCKKQLDLWDFQRYLKMQGEIEKISYKICPNCKKQVPTDAGFCISCGIKLFYFTSIMKPQ